MTFVDTIAPMLLFNLPWKAAELKVRSMFERQWGSLRPAVLFCLRHHQGQHTLQQLQATAGHYRQYARAVQEVGAPLLITYVHVDYCTSYPLPRCCHAGIPGPGAFDS